MDEYTADAFVNRDEPIPLLMVTADDDATSISEIEDSDHEDKRPSLRKRLSTSRLREKAQHYVGDQGDYPSGRQSLQDRLFTKLLQQLIPTDAPDDGTEEPVDRRSSRYVQRPAFSLPLMTNNFRRFNARIGIVFVFQNRLIRLFTWRSPAHTLSFLSVYTFVCLNPYLLVVVPLAVLLLFIMVPAFLARHPPPPPAASTSSTMPYYSYQGPALAPPRTIKPASETSKDFFRNMRDLQNCMADFSMLHDSLIALIAPLTNFSNEVLSSQIYFYLSITTVILFIAANLLPWRFLFLVIGYSATTSGHPAVQRWLEKSRRRIVAKSKAPKAEGAPTVFDFPLPRSLSALPPILHEISAITLDSAPITREVEIFELQHRPLTPFGSDVHEEWTHFLYCPRPYDPLSPARIAGDRPRGARFFEDVQPPNGWSWHTKKWELDLEAREWVAERLITGVEFDVSAGGLGSEEFGGWVWDLPPLVKEPYDDDDDMWLVYGGGSDDIHGGGGETKAQKKKKLGKKEIERQKQAFREKRQKDWEEARYQGKTGEWRRRRWVRVVRRVGMNLDDSVGGPDGNENNGAKGK